MGLGPIPAICRALEKAQLRLEEIDLFEVNEAFASIAVAVGRELHIPDEKLNPLGGAVALGHPIGATGAVITVKLVHELQRRGARYGVSSLCIGGGMGIAAVLERVA
jgi:acetyl-CoA C-acetyltransferase